MSSTHAGSKSPANSSNGSASYPAYPKLAKVESLKYVARNERVGMWAFLTLLALGFALIVTRADSIRHQVARLQTRMNASQVDRTEIHRELATKAPAE